MKEALLNPVRLVALAFLGGQLVARCRPTETVSLTRMAANSIFVISRFSILGALGWRLHRNAPSFEEYREQLFAEDRLSTRFELFKTITAESIAQQQPCDADLHFVLLTSAELPTEYHEKLEAVMRDIEARSDFTCALIDVPADEKHETYTDAYLDGHFNGGPDRRFATIRLDDDDALAASFCRRMSAHLDQGLCGYPVTFAYGYEGFVDTDGKITGVRHWNRPKVSAGLAHTNAWTSSGGYADPRKHIYILGSLNHVDVADALLIDSRAPAFFKCVNDFQDSRGAGSRINLPAVHEHEFAFDEFPWVAKDSIDLPTADEPSSDPFDPSTATVARARQVQTVRDHKKEIKALEKKLKVTTRKLEQAQARQSQWRRLNSLLRRLRRRLRG